MKEWNYLFDPCAECGQPQVRWCEKVINGKLACKYECQACGDHFQISGEMGYKEAKMEKESHPKIESVEVYEKVTRAVKHVSEVMEEKARQILILQAELNGLQKAALQLLGQLKEYEDTHPEEFEQDNTVQTPD